MNVNKPYVLEIEILGLPKMTNANYVNNWKARMGEANKWKTKVIKACYGKAPERPLTRAKIIYTRFSSHKPDYDGCVSGFKHIQDGLKKAGIIIDDTWANIESIYAWEKALRFKGKVTIQIKEVNDEKYYQDKKDN
jgi:Holliday junction resolvase RusA-like endonuclease